MNPLFSTVFPLPTNLSEIAQIEDLELRAQALFLLKRPSVKDPQYLELAETVDVPEASVWGRNVVARTADLVAKANRPKVRKPKAPAPLPSISVPNVFALFADEPTSISCGDEH